MESEESLCISCDSAYARQRCGDCKQLLYCSYVCAQTHWESHKIGCGFWIPNIDVTTAENSSFRKVLYTTSTQQLVVMYLKPGQDIGMEAHPRTTQFVRVVRGTGEAVMGRGISPLEDASIVMVPPGVRHNIIASEKGRGLWLYTIYSPPEHAEDTHQEEKP